MSVNASDKRKALGRTGEAIAARHLQGLGWRVLARNWTCPQGEIDLIAQDGDTVVIVEVRTRRGKEAFNSALASINARKQTRLLRLAEAYRQQMKLAESTPFRIDVVGVALQPGGMFAVEVLRDAVSW
jgi:putative endonuclease